MTNHNQRTAVDSNPMTPCAVTDEKSIGTRCPADVQMVSVPVVTAAHMEVNLPRLSQRPQLPDLPVLDKARRTGDPQ
jgi:hypothetical protein